MEALYSATNRLIQDTQGYFQSLNSNRGDTSEAENHILKNITTINAYVLPILPITNIASEF